MATLTASHLVRRFGERLAVDDVSFDVGEGEVFGLLGPNGAGKTTTLRILGGLISATSGEVRHSGTLLGRHSAARARARTGFLPETPGLWDHLTVIDNIGIYARLFDVPRPDAACEAALRPLGLWDRRQDRAALLSKGMKQKLALARALVHDPDVVLLDEPTANLDPEAARTVRDLLLDLRARGRAVVVSTHNLDEIERLADRVGLVNTRLIAIGEPAELRQRIFGRRLRVRLAAAPDRLAALADTARGAAGGDVQVESDALLVSLRDPARGAAAVIRALVEAGADVLEACEDRASLEDVYLRLVGR